VLVGAVFAISYLIHLRSKDHADASISANPAVDIPAARQTGPTPVALNRGPEVLDGFRGDVHPLLFGQTRLDVSAQWTPVGKGRDQLHRDLNPKLYAWYTELRPAQPRRTYTERDFSAFLPETLGEVGQLWSLDDDKI